MRKIKFRFRLEDKITKEMIVTCAELYNPKYSSDLMQYPINLKEFNVLSIDEYTGLRDKNRMEIYEGDIIKYYDYMIKDYDVCKIEWISEFITYVAKDRLDNDIFIQKIDERRIEIIGNIYENSNLLEVN